MAIAALSPCANAQLYVGEQGRVGVYNSATGTTINASLVATSNTPDGLALSGNTLYVSNAAGNTIGTYNATTGAAINASFITGLNYPEQILLAGNTLYVASDGSGTVAPTTPRLARPLTPTSSPA